MDHLSNLKQKHMLRGLQKYIFVENTLACVHRCQLVVTILPQNALRRDCNGKCIE